MRSMRVNVENEYLLPGNASVQVYDVFYCTKNHKTKEIIYKYNSILNMIEHF